MANDVGLILSYLPAKYQSAYAKGDLTDDDILEFGRTAGIVAAPKAAPVKAAPKPAPDDYKGNYPNLPRAIAKPLDALDSVQGLGEDVADAIKGGVKTFVGSKQFTAGDSGSQAASRLTQGLIDSFDLSHGGSIGGLLQNIQDPNRSSPEQVAARGAENFQAGNKQIEEATNSATQRVTGPTLGKAVTGIAAMPSALLGVAGGPTSIIPSADFFTQEYTKSRIAGLDKPQALKEAGTKAAAMEAIAAIPAGSVLSKVPIVKKLVGDELTGTLARAAGGTLNNVLGEGLKMDAITGSQIALDKGFSTLSTDKKTQDYSKSNIPDDVWTAFKDSFVMGGLMGASRAPMESFKAIAETGQLAGRIVSGQASSEKDIAGKGRKPKATTGDVPKFTDAIQPDLFGTPAGLPTHEDFVAQQQQAAKDQVLKRLQENDAYEQNQPPIDEDAIWQQHERAKQLGQLGQGLDNPQMADALRQADLHKLAAIVSPKPEPAPLPPTDGEQQPLFNRMPIQPAEAARRSAELVAKQLIAKDNVTITNKAKSARQAAMREFTRLTVSASRDIPDMDTRHAYVADAMQKWEAEHPLDNYIKTQQAKREKINPRKKVEAPAIPSGPKEPPVRATVGDEDSLTAEQPIRPEENLKSADQLRNELGLSQSKSRTPDFFRTRLKDLTDEQLDRVHEDALQKWLHTEDPQSEVNPERKVLNSISAERFRRMQEGERAKHGNTVRETVDGVKQIPNGTRVDFTHFRGGDFSGKVVGSKMLQNSHDHSKFFVHRVEYTDASGKTDQVNVLPTDMKKAYVGPRGLAHEGGEDTGVTKEQVFNTIGRTLHKGDTKVAGKLIADKNMMIVDDVSEIPHDAIEQGTGAYYDGERTYIVANKLNPHNLMGDLLSKAAHEIKHGSDFGAGDKVKASLGHIIGEGANKRLGAKVEALAKADSEGRDISFDQLGSKITPEQEASLTPAQWAVHAARQGSTDATYKLELPAYFINAARDERAAKGSVGQLKDNIVAAVRNGAKRRFGDKADVNLKDVAYLSDQLLRQTALAGDRLAGDIGGKSLPMIAGRKSKLFANADQAGRTYISADDNIKFLFSDSEAHLATHAIDMLDKLVDDPKKELRLTDILGHSSMNVHYPALFDSLKVRVAELGNTANGSYRNKVIQITPKMVEIARSDPSRLTNLLLHEMQHAVQDYEGHARGSSPESFYTEADHLNLTAEKDSHKALNTYTTFLTNHLSKITGPESGAKIRELMRAKTDNQLTRDEFLEEAVSAIAHDPQAPEAGKTVAKRLLDALDKHLTISDQADESRQTAYDKYRKTFGEMEARFTEKNRRKTLATLPHNPEDPATQRVGLGFDVPARQGHILKKDGTVIMKSVDDSFTSRLRAKQDAERPQKVSDAFDRSLKRRDEEKANKAANDDGPVGIDAPGLSFNGKTFREASKAFLRPDNKALKIFKSLFSYAGNLGKELNEMREDSTGEAAMHSQIAMNTLSSIRASVEQMARIGVKRGVYKTQADGEAAFNKQINAKLEAIAEIPEVARRQAALSAWVRDNPNMRPVMNAVNDIHQLSKTLLIQMLKTHPDPTPDQLRLMNTIHDNDFRYATRLYAAFQGAAGREHSEMLLKAYTKGTAALADHKSVPEKFREDFKTVNDAMKYLIDHDLTIPELEGLQSSSTDRLNNLYTTWVGNMSEARQRLRAEALKDGATRAEQDQFIRENFIAALDDRAKTIGRKDLEGKAMDLIHGMLGLNPSDSPFATFYRGFAQDRSILEHREKLPVELRELFGEIHDPATRLAVTIAKQGELAARTRLLLDMRDLGEGKWVIKPENAGLPGNERFTVPLTGESYGPVAGWRTTPEVAESVTKTLEMYSTVGQAIAKSYNNSQAAIRALSRVGSDVLTKAAGLQKVMMVAYNLYSIGRNFAGSPVGLVANGVINPKYYVKGLKVGGESVASVLFDSKFRPSQDFLEAVRYGLLDSAHVQEIRSTPQRTIRNLISDESAAVNKGKQLIRRGARGTVETFAMTDAWIKISAFKQRVDVLTKFYKAEGKSMTDEQIKRIAANTIKDTTITYTRVPPAVKVAEGIGLTTYMPYFYSVPRAISYNYIHGVKDIIEAIHAKSAGGKQTMFLSGLQRISGASLATFGFSAATRGLASLINGDDKGKLDETKKLLSTDGRFSDSIYVGKDKQGNPLFWRMSSIDPFGPVNDVIRVFYDDTIPKEDKARFAVSMLGSLFFTNRITQAAIRAGDDFIGTDELKHKSTRIERVAPQLAEKLKDVLTSIPHVDLSDAKSALELIDAFVPSIINAFDPKNTAPSTIKDNDPAFKFLSDMILMTGGRLDKADPGMAAYVAGQSLDKARNDGRERMAEGFAAGSSPEAMLDRYKDAATAEYLALRQQGTVYEGMTQGLGMTPRQAVAVMKESGAKTMTAVDINNIRTGKINLEADSYVNHYSQILSKNSLLQRSKVAEYQMTPAEQKANHQKIQAFIKQMKALGVHVKQ